MDATPSAISPYASETLTAVGQAAVRIVVEPRYVPEESDPGAPEPRWLFIYRVRIWNEGDIPVTLRTRRWIIRDADGDEHQVDGPGVIGQQPRIAPTGPEDAPFEYESFCPLTTPWGTMEGGFWMELDPPPDGAKPGGFLARVDRFYLVSGSPK